ncbi:hypothetical protein SASPL_149458 [Salvia splendens]|uniref:BAH domain-containing protein n=1 Tax=Salvia splendens TaxID=180675 RepID=A0A8X8WBR8_SALSN|nr:uncharacterized protein LOC121779869 [Salvia splendens]KAG6391700.1 hypothetical protein SASPL_149458 [Salvia splendens]
MGATATGNKAAAYAAWEEVAVSTEKGRREVHYYLRRCGGGGRDLVVVGKEKTATHMSYRYKIEDGKLLPSILSCASRVKLRSRREVVDWLESIISGKQLNGSKQFGGGMDRKLDDDVIEDVMKQKLGPCKTKSAWIGSSWTCRKKRTHYQSFCRNGAVISAQEFVYVLAEEGKRLVAYLDDMYEDIRGNKMVVVRWFHKIDEVGFVLPHDYNDREIFFSLCLQDLSIECIDGLATILSPEHYAKYISEAANTALMPFVCCKLFDNDDVKPFDITRVKGYWKQEIFRKSNKTVGESVGLGPNKRIRWSKESELYSKSPDNGESAVTSSQVSSDTHLDCKGRLKKGSKKEHGSSVTLPRRDNAATCKSEQYLAVGSQVEVLSQDSGIRGCWFRALIIKKHKDKVKVQYRDLKDAVDDAKNLEEWILASRLATQDTSGIRLSGRTTVRPSLASEKENVSCAATVGTVVDAWMHDGWWEGIVVKKESDDRFNVYFPDEKQEHTFSAGDLRYSKEWFDNGWQNIKPKPDVVSKLHGSEKISETKKDEPPSSVKIKLAVSLDNDALNQKMIKMPARDLTRDYLLAKLRWRSSGKRSRGRSPVKSCAEAGLSTFKGVFVNSSMKLDPDRCKSSRDSRFSSSVVSPI